MIHAVEQQQKAWLIWLAALTVVGIHLIAIVLITHHYYNQTNQYQRLLDRNQNLLQKISHYEVELAYQIRLSRIEAWAREQGMQASPSQEYKFILPAE